MTLACTSDLVRVRCLPLGTLDCTRGGGSQAAVKNIRGNVRRDQAEGSQPAHFVNETTTFFKIHHAMILSRAATHNALSEEQAAQPAVQAAIAAHVCLLLARLLTDGGIVAVCPGVLPPPVRAFQVRECITRPPSPRLQGAGCC